MNDESQPPGNPDAPIETYVTSSAGTAGSTDGGLVNGDVHLLDRLAIIYRYRAIAISVFILTTVAVVLQRSDTGVPIYRATAQILIDNERSRAIGLASERQLWENPILFYSTQFQILHGRDLARRVVARLRLNGVAEFNGPTAPPRNNPITSIRGLKERLSGLFGEAAPPREAPRPDETPNESALDDAFLSRIMIEPVRNSRLVNVSFYSVDPQFAATAANVLAEEFVAQNLAVKLQSAQNMLERLGKERANQQEKVLEAEARLVDFRDKQNALSLDEKNNIVLARLNKLNDGVVLARTKTARAEVLYKQTSSLAPAELGNAAPIAQNPQVAQARDRVLAAQQERARVAERYLEKHPEVMTANALLTEAQRDYELAVQRAAQAIKNEYDTAALEEQTLTQVLHAAKVDTQNMSRQSIDYNLMEREAKSNRQVYQALLQRENELRISTSQSRANNVRIVDHANIPNAPMGQRSRTWPIGIALGLALAVAVPFVLDYFNDTVKTPEDITERLRLPCLGLVPSIRSNGYPLLASSHVPDDFGEAFRSVRTALMSKFEESRPQSVIFTSAQPLEGKTTTAINVALALAYGGARVLVIDGDMRRPGLHQPLRLVNERGLSQILTGQARMRDVIQRTVDPNLLAVTAGPPPPNPSELLTSERTETLLTNLAHGPFDWILIDTPPVLAVTDAMVLAPLVSGVTLVIGAEMTRRRLAERAAETIFSAGPKKVVAVLNKVDFARNKYYYSRHHGYQYKNYYARAI